MHSGIGFPKLLKLAGRLAITTGLVSSCSLSETTKQINVDYNYTIEAITNELTLLNIMRAREGLPLHYTSVARLTGSVILKGTAGFNASLKGSAPTDTTVGSSAAAPTGHTITDTLTHAVASGGNVYTPSIGAEVDTGPSFDINILDTQAFYQGILASIPASTVKNFLLQGYDTNFLMKLVTQQLDFTLKDSVPNVAKSKDDVLATMKASDSAFNRLIECFAFGPGSKKSKGTAIAPLSRVRIPKNGTSMTLADLALIDGTKLDLSQRITSSPDNDKNIDIVRPPSSKDAVTLTKREDCKDPLPETPPADVPYIGAGRAMVLGKDKKTGVIVQTDATITFRSTEGVIQFLGGCLKPVGDGSELDCKVGDDLLFSVRRGRPSNAIVSTKVLNQDYSIVKDANLKPTMQALSLIERLINLQKSSTDKPATVPVQIVP